MEAEAVDEITVFVPPVKHHFCFSDVDSKTLTFNFKTSFLNLTISLKRKRSLRIMPR